MKDIMEALIVAIPIMLLAGLMALLVAIYNPKHYGNEEEG